MKRLFFVSLLMVLSFSYSLQAQETKFGLKAGGNLSTISGKEADSKFRLGYHGGIFASIGISEQYSLQPEILYSFQGAAAEGNNEDNKGFTNLSYLNIPILGKIYVTEAFNIKFGPQVGFLLGAKGKITKLLGNEVDIETDLKDDLKTLDYGVAVDLGYDLPSGPLLGLRYNLGLANINESGDESASNQVVQLYVGYAF